MPCGSCVHDLAFRLVGHHRKSLDWIRALELSEKAVERVERRPHSLTDEEKADFERRGIDPDYTLPCVPSGTLTCKYQFGLCIKTSGTCSCACAPPLANSYLVTTSCSVFENCGVPTSCIGQCQCSAAYQCSYACNDGYTWNGSACVIEGAGQQLFTLINQEDY